MSYMKDCIALEEEIKRILIEIKAIEYCDCGCCYHTIQDGSDVYARVFYRLNQNKTNYDGNFVKKAIKQVLDEGYCIEECSHCGKKF